MKKSALLIASLLTAFGTSVFAADMPVKAPAAAPVAVYNWSGIYGGVSAGYEWGKVQWDYYQLPGQSLTRHPEGSIWGGHLGAQYQFKQFVFGVEGSYTGAFGENLDTGPDAPVFAAAFTSAARIHRTITVGGRAGWVFSPQWMAYVTGGWAEAEVWTAYYANGFPQFPSQVMAWHENGWYTGGGVEYLVTNNIYVGAEYRHIELNTVLAKNTIIPAVGSARYITPSSDQVQIRLGFKFAPSLGGAVIAKY